MSWYKDGVDRYEVTPVDESIVMHCYNDSREEQIAVISFDVEGAEECVKLLQKAIEEAKKSKYYQPKGE